MPTELFPFLENLFTKREPITSKTQFKETFMAIKFLSLYPGSFSLAVKANCLMMKLPDWAINSFLFQLTPKQRPPRLHYPKGAEKQKTWPKEALHKIIQKYCCSEDHAVQILNILSLKDDKILETIGIGKEAIGGRRENKQISKRKLKTK